MLHAKVEKTKQTEMGNYKVTITLENGDELIGYADGKKNATKKLSEMVEELKL